MQHSRAAAGCIQQQPSIVAAVACNLSASNSGGSIHSNIDNNCCRESPWASCRCEPTRRRLMTSCLNPRLFMNWNEEDLMGRCLPACHTSSCILYATWHDLHASPTQHTTHKQTPHTTHTTHHNTAQRNTTRHGTTQHDTTQHNTIQHHIAEQSRAEHSTSQRNTSMC
jgi:hypothetical protein